MANNDTSTANSADGNARTTAARSSSASRSSAASRGNTRAAKASEDAMKKQIAGRR